MSALNVSELQALYDGTRLAVVRNDICIGESRQIESRESYVQALSLFAREKCPLAIRLNTGDTLG